MFLEHFSWRRESRNFVINVINVNDLVVVTDTDDLPNMASLTERPIIWFTGSRVQNPIRHVASDALGLERWFVTITWKFVIRPLNVYVLND